MKHHLCITTIKTAILALLTLGLGCAQAAQQPVAYAKILNPLAGTIAQQHEIDSTRFYWRRDAQACSRHPIKLAHESANYNSRVQFACDKNLRDLFRGCSVHDLALIFNYYLTNGDLTELEILNRYGLYTNPAFLAYITTLPGYTKHINSLHSQAHHCKTCKERVAKQMRFNDPNAVMRFLDDAQQRIDTARAEQLRRVQIARQQEILQQQQPQQQQQKKALTQNKKTDSQKSISKKYKLRYTTQELLEKHGISAREFTEFEGDPGQDVLHGEFIKIMDSAADLDLMLKSVPHKSNKQHAKQSPTKQSYRFAHKQALAFFKQNKSAGHNYKIKNHFVNNCKTLIIKSADIGVQSNKKGDTAYARKIADFCYVALGCAQDVALDIAIGAGEGVYQGVKNVGNMVIHPIDTGLNMAHATHTIVACVYSTIIAAESGEISVDFDRVYDLVIKKASQATVRGVVRGVAEIATETILTGKLCGVIAEFIESTQIISRVSRGAKRAARAVKALKKEKPLYVTPEGIEVYIVEGASSAGKAGRALSAESKTGNLAKRANILKSEMDSASATGHAVGRAQGKAAVVGTKQLVTTEAQDWIKGMQKQVMADLHPELLNLKEISIGKATGIEKFANKQVKMAHEHILGMELKFSDKGVVTIGGFHHDPMRYIDTSGFFELVNKVELPSGVYGGLLKYQGYPAKYEASFFPSDWSREKVVDKIYEAYNNFIKSGAKAEFRSGKYHITGVTKDGVKIQMHITTNGEIKSAYPILKKDT